MKEIRKHPAAKFLAVLLTIVFMTLGILSMIGIYMSYEYGCYNGKPKEELLKDEYEMVLDRYSIQALSEYGGDFNRQKLDKTNFRYGVIEGDESRLKEIDLNDPASYVTRNFDKNVSTEDLHIFSYTIEPGTWFRVSDNYFNRENYIYTNDYYIDPTTNYEWVNGMYFIQDSSVLIMTCYDSTYQTQATVGENGEDIIYVKNGSNSDIEIPCDCVSVFKDEETFEKQTGMNLDNVTGIVPQFDYADFFDDGSFDACLIVSKNEDEEAKTRTYTIVSFMNQPLARKNSFVENDMFVWAEDSVGFLFRVRYWLFVTLPLSFAVAAYLVYFLITAAGHRRGTDEISRSVVDNIPQDLFALGLAAYGLGFVILLKNLIPMLDLSNIRIIAYVLGLATVCGAILFMLFVMNFSSNVKMGKWWEHLFIFRICVLIVKGIKKLYGGIAEGARGTVNAAIIWVLFALVTALEFGLLCTFNYMDDWLLAFFILERLCLAALIVIFLIQVSRLKKGCRTIREGNIETKIETKGFIPDFKDVARDVNSIGDGLNEAVAERLKSERFRTELITNVSHDIKTPLTSIINYTDLLSRENIENENAKEYLEVLSRQSAKLKKLIEDLIEASKASTGNLKINIEKLNAGTMLTQASAEYERRLADRNVTMVTTIADEDVTIEADSRHLWRVFDNFLNNINKYSMPGTRAYLDVSRDHTTDEVVITFKNTSKEPLNISEEELMERFVRGDSSRNTEGSGLGLSIARSLTELMNGGMYIKIDGDLFKAEIRFPHTEKETDNK